MENKKRLLNGFMIYDIVVWLDTFSAYILQSWINLHLEFHADAMWLSLSMAYALCAATVAVNDEGESKSHIHTTLELSFFASMKSNRVCAMQQQRTAAKPREKKNYVMTTEHSKQRESNIAVK